MILNMLNTAHLNNLYLLLVYLVALLGQNSLLAKRSLIILLSNQLKLVLFLLETQKFIIKLKVLLKSMLLKSLIRWSTQLFYTVNTKDKLLLMLENGSFLVVYV